MMMTAAAKANRAPKVRARIMPAKEFWTPKRLARLERDIALVPRLEEFRRIIREVESN